jgi:hypothetical protein
MEEGFFSDHALSGLLFLPSDNRDRHESLLPEMNSSVMR